MKRLLLLLVLIAGMFQIGFAQAKSHEPISPDTASQLVELIRLGRGSTEHVAFSPDGQIIAVASSVGVWLYDAAALNLESEPPLLDTVGTAEAMAFSPDGATLAVVTGYDLQYWDVAARVMTAATTLSRSSVSIAYSPDGSTLAINTGYNGILLWDIATNVERATIQGSMQGDAAMVFSPDGTLIACATSDYKGHIWRTADASEVAVLTGHTRYVYDFAFSPDASVLVSVSYDETVRVWDVGSGAELGSLVGTEEQPVSEGYALAVSPDGMTLASGHADGAIVIWDVNNMTPRLVFGPQMGEIVDLAFSPDGTQLASVSSENLVQLWDAAAGTEITQAVGHTDYMQTVSFSPDSSSLALTDASENVWLWTVAGLQQLNLTTPIPDAASTGTRNDIMAGYSPDGQLFASTDGFDVILLDAATGAEVRRLDGCSGVMMSFAFSPDSSLLAVASSGGLCVFTIASGELSAVFPSGDWLNTVAFSPDQTLIATAGKDHTVRVYGLP